MFFFFFFFWLHYVFTAVCELPLLVASGDYFLIMVYGFLIAVASLVEEHGVWASGLQ